jgi:hypothetical protein
MSAAAFLVIACSSSLLAPTVSAEILLADGQCVPYSVAFQTVPAPAPPPAADHDNVASHLLPLSSLQRLEAALRLHSSTLVACCTQTPSPDHDGLAPQASLDPGDWCVTGCAVAAFPRLDCSPADYLNAPSPCDSFAGITFCGDRSLLRIPRQPDLPAPFLQTATKQIWQPFLVSIRSSADVAAALEDNLSVRSAGYALQPVAAGETAFVVDLTGGGRAR